MQIIIQLIPHTMVIDCVLFSRPYMVKHNPSPRGCLVFASIRRFFMYIYLRRPSCTGNQVRSDFRDMHRPASLGSVI